MTAPFNGLDEDINKNNTLAYNNNKAMLDLQAIADLGGLANCCDVEFIKPYILNAKKILEVGAGYGRVIKHLLLSKLDARITAVEEGGFFYDLLNVNFAGEITLHKADIRKIKFNSKFDCILWLWGGIADFPQREQLYVLQKLQSMLETNGILIFDTIPNTVIPINAKAKIQQDISIKMGAGKLQVYIPSVAEIDNYAKQLGFSHIKHESYKTSTLRSRIMHYFCQ